MSTLLKSSIEAAQERIVAVLDTHPIPPITDPMGKHWSQPNRSQILIDATHAVMTQETFDQLAEYSCSFPTGVYPGKMWKCNVGAFNHKVKPEDRYWQLRWFGHHEDPAYVSNNYRTILILNQ